MSDRNAELKDDENLTIMALMQDLLRYLKSIAQHKDLSFYPL